MIPPPDAAETLRAPFGGTVRQFSVFIENKAGRLHELVDALIRSNVHIMAFCMIDTTDSAILRLVVDYPDLAEAVLNERFFAHDTVPVVAVQIPGEHDLGKITSALARAEINIHYLYSFLARPGGCCGIVLRLEDNELGAEVLRRSGLAVLDQNDIAR
ncbi:MAG: acetolactate synthase [Puniceicoccales bacterium]|jgi:hypothetical protein|nr:acetolactate synthase [Puniceicoccales bacterium]